MLNGAADNDNSNNNSEEPVLTYSCATGASASASVWGRDARDMDDADTRQEDGESCLGAPRGKGVGRPLVLLG